jgi:hypothetical protein
VRGELSPASLFLDDESNPEQDLPACPGSFHFQGDNKRFEPHGFTSKFKGKAIGPCVI